MKVLFILLLVVFTCTGIPQVGAQMRHDIEVIEVDDAEELQDLLADAIDFVEIRLAPGIYELEPTADRESVCGNCDTTTRDLPFSYGLRLSGIKVGIVGPEEGRALIRTNAGYGLHFLDCEECFVENLTITGGRRDSSADASNAGIVVQRSDVTIVNNHIEYNIGGSDLVAANVVGIMGICGRENSRSTIIANHIRANSWDGIALYRDAQAAISDNVIDGVDKARSGRIGGGRGVGISLSWNASASLRNNVVRRYWKGIGISGAADAIVKGNIVEDILTWGIAIWDARGSSPGVLLQSNVIYNTGACGALINIAKLKDGLGLFQGNFLVQTGLNEAFDAPEQYCYQCALAEHKVPPGFRIRDNVFFGNRRGDDRLPDRNISAREFDAAIKLWCERAQKREAFAGSDFLRRVCSSNEDDDSGAE